MGAVVELAFHVVLDQHELKLTAKSKAFGKPFDKSIVEPFLSAINKRRPGKASLTLDGLEAILIAKVRVADTSVLVGSLVPAGDTPSTPVLRVDLVPREERQVRVTCNGLQLDATLPPEHVHLPLRESVVAHMLNRYNEKFSATIELQDVTQVTVDGSLVDDCGRCSDLLRRKGERTALDLTLTAQATKKYPGYSQATTPDSSGAEPTPPPQQQPPQQVFCVRCNTVELKLTLPAKSFNKTLRDGVLVPFLGAYAQRMGGRKAVRLEDVSRVEVDGLAVADSLRAASLISAAPVTRVELFLAAEVGADTWVHARTHTYTYTHTRTHANAHAHMQTHARMHARTHTHTHARTHTTSERGRGTS